MTATGQDHELRDAITSRLSSEADVTGVLIGYVVVAEVYETDGVRTLAQASSEGITAWARIGMLDAALAQNRHDFIDTTDGP